MPDVEFARRLMDRFRSLEFWLRACCLLVVAFSLFQILLFSHGRDQTIYATVADGILHGELPYRDRWDFKPPGIFLVHTLAQFLFGKAMWGVRLLEVLGLVGMCWCMVQLARRFFGDDRPGYLAAAVATLIHSQLEFWHSGQPESFGGMLTVLGIWRISDGQLRYRKQVVNWWVCGLIFGAAFLLKPPLGGGAMVCGAYLVRQRYLKGERGPRAWSPLWIMAAASLLPIVLVGMWFFLAGGWEDLKWTFLEFTPGYTQLSWKHNAAGSLYFAATSAVSAFSALIFFGVLAAGFGRPLAVREREGILLILGVATVHVTGIALQAKFFQYHYGATLPLLAIVAGLGWFKVWRVAVLQGAGGAVAFASLIVVLADARLPVTDVPLGYWQRCWVRVAYALGLSEQHDRQSLDRLLYCAADFDLASNRDVATRIAERCRSGDGLYVWGFEPSIYWLSGCEPVSRYIYNVPQRARWRSEVARARLLAELTSRPPRFFVVQHGDYFKFVTDNDLDSAGALTTFPELERRLARDYRRFERIGDFELYERLTLDSELAPR